MLTAAYHILHASVPYQGLGPVHFARRDKPGGTPRVACSGGSKIGQLRASGSARPPTSTETPAASSVTLIVRRSCSV